MKKKNYKDYNINHNKKQYKYINKRFSRLNERENMIKL